MLGPAQRESEREPQTVSKDLPPILQRPRILHDLTLGPGASELIGLLGFSL